jgi:hypothetical protein
MCSLFGYLISKSLLRYIFMFIAPELDALADGCGADVMIDGEVGVRVDDAVVLVGGKPDFPASITYPPPTATTPTRIPSDFKRIDCLIPQHYQTHAKTPAPGCSHPLRSATSLRGHHTAIYRMAPHPSLSSIPIPGTRSLSQDSVLYDPHSQYLLPPHPRRVPLPDLGTYRTMAPAAGITGAPVVLPCPGNTPCKPKPQTTFIVPMLSA